MATKEEIRLLLGNDAVHIKGFFQNTEICYKTLLAELKERERIDGSQKTYWRDASTNGRQDAQRAGPSVTRVKRMADLQRFPRHAAVVHRMADRFNVEVEGWWLNHYLDGSDVKQMHRDGWGRNRGVNITIGASFGGSRKLRFEGSVAGVEPKFLEHIQIDGDIFAFGEKVNSTYRHGVPAEANSEPRISVIIMGRAPHDWIKLAHGSSWKIPPHVEHVASRRKITPQVEDITGRRRRWGQNAEGSPPSIDAAATDAVMHCAVSSAGRRWHTKALDRANQAIPHSRPSSSTKSCLVWLRDDLRLADNPALDAAAALDSRAIVPAFVHDTTDANPWPVRGAALWWKGESLKAFDASLRLHCSSRVVIRSGPVEDELLALATELDADTLYFNRQVEPWYRSRDDHIEERFRAKGFVVKSFKSVVLQEPWEGSPSLSFIGQSATADGKPATMFDEISPGKINPVQTAWNGAFDGSIAATLSLPEVVPIINADRLLSNPNPCAQLLTALGEDDQEQHDHRRRDADHFRVYRALEDGSSEVCPLPSIRGRLLRAPVDWPQSLEVEDLGYLQTSGMDFPKAGTPQSAVSGHGDWASEMRVCWRPGEDAALRRLHEFVDAIETHKRPDRHRADLRNTSLLSPHLRFGEISPRQCYHEAMRAPAHLRHGFIRRVLWRDLSYAELYRWPDMPKLSQRLQYEEQWWSGADSQLKKWQRGETGFPLIDAGMRQLWKEGYINNYMRHVTAGFLVDYLDISWKHGFDWYDYTLVDSDAAINARLWQQGGHSGISQWNFVMHPVFAAKNADPNGDYVKRWIPELAGVPIEFIHCPWEAPLELMSAGVRLGSSYPRRILLDLIKARKQHLRHVIAVREKHPETIGADGTEYLLLRDGSRVLLRTRDDIRQDTDELVVAQTAGAMHEKFSRVRRKTASLSYYQTLIEHSVSGLGTGRGHNDEHIL